MSYYDSYSELKNEKEHYIWSASAADPWGAPYPYTSTGTRIQIDQQKILNDDYMSEISKLRNKIEQSDNIIHKLSQENEELKKINKKLNKFTRFQIMEIE